MFEKVKPYMGNYMLYTKKAVACIAFATLCSVVPYFLLYGMIHPLVTEGTLLWSNVLLLITGTALCLILNAVLYVKGLSYSHYSAYHTLENIRISLQQRLEKQPLCCWNCSHTVGCLIFISSKCNNINLLHWIFILCV